MRRALPPEAGRNHPDVVFEFGHDASAPSQARRAFQFLLDAHFAAFDDVILAVSELVTNVVRHTDNGGIVRGWGPSASGLVRIEVEDASPTRPNLRDHAPDGPGGRGLPIIDHLSSAWGVTTIGSRKLVWAEIRDRQPR
jgi:hypothetical protein